MVEIGSQSTRVGVLGLGAIGRTLADHLAAGLVRDARLECVVSDIAVADPPAPQVTMDEAIERCDLILECAGQGALRAYAEPILRSGTDLLVASIGALMDESFHDLLRNCSPGRMFWTSGAIGGLDLLAASRRSGPFDRVSLTTTKLPTSLVQPWMSQAEVDRVRAATSPIPVFDGTAQEAARLFPKSLNVAAAVSLTIDTPDVLTVSLRADPAATLVSHVIEASGPCGSYRFEMSNIAADDNPRTSKVVPFAMLRTLDVILGNSQ